MNKYIIPSAILLGALVTVPAAFFSRTNQSTPVANVKKEPVSFLMQPDAAPCIKGKMKSSDCCDQFQWRSCGTCDHSTRQFSLKSPENYSRLFRARPLTPQRDSNFIE